MKLHQIIKNSRVKNTFTIISDDETSVLLFEGKTVHAAQGYDFHSRHEEAYFNKKKVKHTWRSPLELYSRIVKQFNQNPNSLVEYQTEEDLFSFLDKNNLYCSDDCFSE